jgi:hypothetical protein
MSEVIGFLLDDRNPLEARALSVIARWQEQGYSVRQILTEALISLEKTDTGAIQQLQIEEILTAVKKMSVQFEQLKQTGLPILNNEQRPQAVLSDAFVLSVKNTAKTGVRLNE